MEIRPAHPADAAAVVALWTEAYTDDSRGGRSTPYEEAEFEEALRLGEVWVAAGEAAEGVVVLYQPGVRDGQFAVGGELELCRLAVARSARGRGLGRRLVELCMRRAEEAGTGLVLWSQPHQGEAHRLYGSLGFRRAPERDRRNREGPQLVFVRER